MKSKSRAIWSLVFTIIIAIYGIIVYSDNGTMAFFGIINLSPFVFFLLILVWLVVDIFAIRNAGKQAKELEEKNLNLQEKVSQFQPTERLEQPCTLAITRTSSMLGAAMGVTVFLNGTEVGVLKNGQTLNFTTVYANNDLTVVTNADNVTRSLTFPATPGGFVHFTFKYSGAILTQD